MSLEGKEKLLDAEAIREASKSFDAMKAAYEKLSKELSGGCSGLRFNLKGLPPEDHQAVSFILSCSALCAKKGLPVSFANVDPGLLDALSKLGVSEDGAYAPKSMKDLSTQPFVATVGEDAICFVKDLKKLVGFVGETAIAFLDILKNPFKLDRREILFYMDRSGADAVPIVILICFLMGLILAFQGIMQLGKFGLNSFVADLVGLAIVRELGPLMVGMICIGRAGSAYAAELGTMKASEEIDALCTMGIKPARLLVLPKIAALVMVMPFLVIIGDLSGIAGGVVIGTGMTDITVQAYNMRTISSLIPANILESVVKALVFAFIIAAVGCYRGFEAERDAKGVGNATTSSVVSGVFLLVVADFAVTFSFPHAMALIGVSY